MKYRFIFFHPIHLHKNCIGNLLGQTMNIQCRPISDCSLFGRQIIAYNILIPEIMTTVFAFFYNKNQSLINQGAQWINPGLQSLPPPVCSAKPSSVNMSNSNSSNIFSNSFIDYHLLFSCNTRITDFDEAKDDSVQNSTNTI